MKKKKILIVENLMHFWQVDDLYKLFSIHFDCDVLIPKKFRHISNLKKNVISSNLRYFIYFHILLIGRKYDYIYLCSCPEYPDYPNNFKNFLLYCQQLVIFLVLILFFRKKIIPHVRGLHRIFPDIYKDNVTKFFVNLRYRIFLLLDLFTCENKNLTEIFKKKFKKKKYKVTTVYTRYYDENIIYEKKLNSKFTIGLIGGIDPIRRDYSLIYKNFLNQKEQIKFIFLGKFYENLSENVIKKFQGLDFEYKQEFLSEEDFIKMGRKCDVLLSLNKKEKFYGEYKGTGSYGDAMFLQKPLLIPSFVDPIMEFKDFCNYYDDIIQLKLLINKFIKNQTILDKKFNNFEIRKCSEKIISELNL